MLKKAKTKINEEHTGRGGGSTRHTFTQQVARSLSLLPSLREEGREGSGPRSYMHVARSFFLIL